MAEELVAALFVYNGSGMRSTGFAWFDAPRAVFLTLPAGSGRARRQLWQWHACSWFCWYLCFSRCVTDDCRHVGMLRLVVLLGILDIISLSLLHFTVVSAVGRLR